jgi:hypothetical protein
VELNLNRCPMLDCVGSMYRIWRIDMDAIESKLNVIHWLTDYKGKVVEFRGRKFVELNHKDGFLKWMFGCQSTKQLLTKLDAFIDRKLSTKFVDIPMNKTKL